MEEIEMGKQRKSLDRDVDKLIDKYMRAMEWNIPEVDEDRARQLILDEVRSEIDKLDSRH